MTTTRPWRAATTPTSSSPPTASTAGVRTAYAETFEPDIDLRRNRFVWLGTEKAFDAFTFAFVQTPHGWFQAHAYRFEPGVSTFIVETPEDAAWQAAGLDKMSQQEGIRYCETLFAPWLDGKPLMSNAGHLRGSAIWIRFSARHLAGTGCAGTPLDTPRGRRDVPVVLMGDAAHSAHFSIGSGTKLALEDAIELADQLTADTHRAAPTAGPLPADQGPGSRTAHPRSEQQRGASQIDALRAALQRYEDIRSVEVLRIQNAARNSTEWFEHVDRYACLQPEQFAYSLLTRSQRISHENLRLRDPAWLQDYERWLAARAGVDVGTRERPPLPMLTPYEVRGVRLKNRIVVSPMAMYACTDGVPGDFHLVHLGAKAMGGAGLVMVEMTCTSPDARITPGCPGLWNDEQGAAFARIAAFVHGHSDARIGIQLGHAGRKGSTQLGWQQADHPLASGNWPCFPPRPCPICRAFRRHRTP